MPVDGETFETYAKRDPVESVELNSMRALVELDDSEEVLGNLRGAMNHDAAHELESGYRFESGAEGVMDLISGPTNGYAFHGSFAIDQIGDVGTIVEDYLKAKDKDRSMREEDYVLGLYMHDPSRPEAIVHALGLVVNERRQNG